MWGKEVSPMVRKETKKEEKKHNFTCMPASAGNGGGGCGGLHAPRWGCSCPSCVGCGDGPCGVVAATRRQAVKEEKKNCIWVKGGNEAEHISMSNEVARLVAHFPMPWINPPSNALFVKVLVTCAPAHIQHNTVLTPSWVLPLPLLQTRHSTTLHHSHPPTSDATTLITTLCILFYFILFYFILFYFILFYFILFYFILFHLFFFKVIFKELLPHPPLLHRDHHYSARKRDDHTILSAGTQATTLTSHPSLAPTPAAAIAPFAGTQVMFFSFLFFRPFPDQCYRDSLPHVPGPQTPTPPPCLPPQAF